MASVSAARVPSDRSKYTPSELYPPLTGSPGRLPLTAR